MAGMAERICSANQLSSKQGGPIAIVAGQVEQLQKLPVQQVRCCCCCSPFPGCISVVVARVMAPQASGKSCCLLGWAKKQHA